jgi:hypothetical protein
VHLAGAVAGAARHSRFWSCQPTRAHGRRVPGDEAEAKENGRHTLRESHYLKDAGPASDLSNQRSSAHNREVRRFAAILMLVIFASLNAIDGICCPDGCTHEEDASSTRSLPEGGGAICVLCVGGLSSAAPEDLSPDVPVVSAVARIAATRPLDVPPDPPEHPPRS